MITTNRILSLTFSACIAAGCSSQPPKPTITTPASGDRTLTACERAKSLPPSAVGAARTGEGQQPVLVVQDECSE